MIIRYFKHKILNRKTIRLKFEQKKNINKRIGNITRSLSIAPYKKDKVLLMNY